jgi:hypothetical protein
LVTALNFAQNMLCMYAVLIIWTHQIHRYDGVGIFSEKRSLSLSLSLLYFIFSFVPFLSPSRF